MSERKPKSRHCECPQGTRALVEFKGFRCVVCGVFARTMPELREKRTTASEVTLRDESH